MVGKAKINLYLDIALFVAFVVSLETSLTGVAVHEWLGLALGATLLVHLILHWKWVTAVVKRFFQKLAVQARINFILNVALLTAFTLIIVSGFMISHTLGTPQLLGIDETMMAPWKNIHFMAADVTMFLVGLHVALHWRWIVNALKRYVLKSKIRQSVKPGKLSPKLATSGNINK